MSESSQHPHIFKGNGYIIAFSCQRVGEPESERRPAAHGLMSINKTCFLNITFGMAAIVASGTTLCQIPMPPCEQQKVIKYNQLVSNLTILHNVQNMTRALKELATKGIEITPDIQADLSPYWRKHINRFGDYRPDYDISASKLEYDLLLLMMP